MRSSFLTKMFANLAKSPQLNNILNKNLGRAENLAWQHQLNKNQLQCQETALKIQEDLNAFERAHPRKDPALQGLDTAKWRVYYYQNYTTKQTKAGHGWFDYKFRFVAINLQKPYRYQLNLFEGYDYRYGKMILNAPIGSLTDKERKHLRTGHLPTGYQKVTKTTPLPVRAKRYDQNKYYNENDEKDFKIGSNRKQTIGNLAAVRLAIKGGTVKPKGKKRKIVFWVGRARRIEKDTSISKGRGRGLSVQGYVFVNVRRYNSGGHDWYRKQIEGIIRKDVNRFMDLLW